MNSKVFWKGVAHPPTSIMHDLTELKYPYSLFGLLCSPVLIVLICNVWKIQEEVKNRSSDLRTTRVGPLYPIWKEGLFKRCNDWLLNSSYFCWDIYHQQIWKARRNLCTTMVEKCDGLLQMIKTTQLARQRVLSNFGASITCNGNPAFCKQFSSYPTIQYSTLYIKT